MEIEWNGKVEKIEKAVLFRTKQRLMYRSQTSSSKGELTQEYLVTGQLYNITFPTVVHNYQKENLYLWNYDLVSILITLVYIYKLEMFWNKVLWTNETKIKLIGYNCTIYLEEKDEGFVKKQKTNHTCSFRGLLNIQFYQKCLNLFMQL